MLRETAGSAWCTLTRLVSVQDLTDFHAAHYTPGNLVVAASGASADVVQSLASGYLGGLPASAPPSAPRSVYVGGDRCDHWAGGSHALIAFETSGWKDLNGSVMTTVVQVCPVQLWCLPAWVLFCKGVDVQDCTRSPCTFADELGCLPTGQFACSHRI